MKQLLPLLGLLPALSSAGAQTAADARCVYTPDQLTATPVLLRQPAEYYPDSLKRAGIGGSVRVSVELDSTGHPDSASVRVFSSPDSLLNEPARAAVLGSVFAPGRLDNRRVRVRLALEIGFDPLGAAPPPPPVYAGGDSVTDAPAPLRGAPLEYPEEMRRTGAQARVMAQFIVDTLGRVEMESLQYVAVADPAFLFSVQQYLAAARFRPARRAGRAVRCLVSMPLDFRIRGARFPPAPIPEPPVKCRP